ncbi:hypothetical protein LWI29_022328 [Acer saccharum]|uniref:Uncharacterized protein n=1 Tax=Acer saccharum TaxID=4024 RepID=A0AA39VTY9_ACESA|nr:hypothetical protein LWI29_022328 [Acer saccharum]
MGFDGRDKVPVWQFHLVEDLDAFDVFPWGTHVYRRSIYGFKLAFDGPRQRLAEKRRQEGEDLDVQNLELTYNIYGLPHALLVFTFEVIPELGISKCGIRRTIKLLPPRILKWELSQRPRGKKLDGVFTKRMVAWPELVPTVAERAQRYIEGINLEANMYDSDHIPDPERHRPVGPNDMEGLFSRPSDTEAMFSRRDDMEASYSGGTGTEGSEVEGGNRRRRVRFTVPRQPRREGDVDLEARTESLKTRRQPQPGGDSRGGDPEGWDHKIDEVMDAVRSVRDDVMAAIKKSDEARDKQHGELLDMIRALQGTTPQSRMDGPPFDDPPFDDGHGDFSPGRTGTGQDRTEPGSRHGQPPTTEGQSMDTVSDQRGQGATEREEVPGDTEIAEAAQVPPLVLPDSTTGAETALVPFVAPGGSELPLG